MIKTSAFTSLYHMTYARLHVVPAVLVSEELKEGTSTISWERAVDNKLIDYLVISMVKGLLDYKVDFIRFPIIGRIFAQSKPFRVNSITLHPEDYAIAHVTGQQSERIIQKWEDRLSTISGLQVALSWDMVVEGSFKWEKTSGDGSPLPASTQLPLLHT